SGLFGMGGNDLLVASPNNDGIDGGTGGDTVSYERSPIGVSVDLGMSGKSQLTDPGHYDTLTDVENLVGSPHADELTGDDGPNTIDGGGGADSIVAKAARDELLLRDGAPDQATCGFGVDHVVADRQGTDAIFSDCENVDFAPVAPPTPTPAPDPGTPSGNPTPAPADHLAPALTALKLKRKTISYKLSEPAAVKLRVQRKVGGRWKTLRGSLSQAGHAGLNKLRFGRRLARASYRLSAVATDAAGNRSRQR